MTMIAIKSIKTNNKIHNLSIDKLSSDKIFNIIGELSNKLKINLSPIYNYVQLIYYPIGVGFNIHTDGITYNKTSYNQIKQHMYTMLIYLNTVDVGGETYFPDLKLKIKPRCGCGLIIQIVSKIK